MNKSPSELKERFHIRYEGEVGVDSGGLTR